MEIQGSVNRIEKVLQENGFASPGAQQQKQSWATKNEMALPSTPDVIAETKQKAILMVPIALYHRPYRGAR